MWEPKWQTDKELKTCAFFVLGNPVDNKFIRQNKMSVIWNHKMFAFYKITVIFNDQLEVECSKQNKI